MTHSYRSYVERNAARKEIRKGGPEVGGGTMLRVTWLGEKDGEIVGRLVDR